MTDTLKKPVPAKKKLIIAVNGINNPDNQLGTLIAQHVFLNKNYALWKESLTSLEPKKEEKELFGYPDSGDCVQVSFITLEKYPKAIKALKKWCSQNDTDLFLIDPDCSQAVAEICRELDIPFVAKIRPIYAHACMNIMEGANIPAVISSNMILHEIIFIYAIKHIADKFPGVFSAYDLVVRESSPPLTKGRSVIAEKISEILQGAGANEDFFHSDRSPDVQRHFLKIPPKFIQSHATHLFELLCKQMGVEISFDWKTFGDRAEINGFMAALEFLIDAKILGARGDFSMFDVLAGAQSIRIS